VLSRSTSRKVNLVNAMQIAEQRGWQVAESARRRSVHTDSIRIELETDRGVTTVEGAVFLEKPRLTQVDGIYCEVALAGFLIFMKNRDVPGVIGHVGTVLGKNRINIANFSLGRRDSVARIMHMLNQSLGSKWSESRWSSGSEVMLKKSPPLVKRPVVEHASRSQKPPSIQWQVLLRLPGTLENFQARRRC
jgi:hypothetical protein